MVVYKCVRASVCFRVCPCGFVAAVQGYVLLLIVLVLETLSLIML